MVGPTHQNQKKWPQKNDKPPSWAVVKGLFIGKHLQTQQKQQQQEHEEQQTQQQKKMKKHKRQQQQQPEQVMEETGKKCKKMRCSGSLCSNTKVMNRPETASAKAHKKRASLGSSGNTDASGRSKRAPLSELNGLVSSSTISSLSVSSATASSVRGSFRGMPFRRFSGCYECKLVVDPVLGIAINSSLKGSICSCPECGEILMKAEILELYQAVRHAVSELGPEDTSKNIVEIIFQSSWLKKQTSICQIDRVLKVQNISKFEKYRDSIKSKATKLPKKHPRCIADGNELLRFHCPLIACSLGLSGSSNLCNTIPKCNVCSIIKNGFKVAQEITGVRSKGKGILTTATSSKAHDKAAGIDDGNDKRAMLICRGDCWESEEEHGR